MTKKVSRKYYERKKTQCMEFLSESDFRNFTGRSWINDTHCENEFENKPALLGVNWSCCGTVTVEEAKEFVKWLTLHIEMAEAFNELFKDTELVD